MSDDVFTIVPQGVPVTKKIVNGRRKGDGKNIRLLNRMKVGESIWDVPYAKMKTLRKAAYLLGIKLKVRMQPDLKLYAIWKL